MWVYQEKRADTSVLVPASPGVLPQDGSAQPFTKERAPVPAVSGTVPDYPAGPATDKAKILPRRKPFRASRDCILLAASYLFGTMMSGILLALCNAEEAETLHYYLSCWQDFFTVLGPAQAVGLFGAELAVVVGAAVILLLLGLSAVGPLPVFFFTMLYGTGSGLLPSQLLSGLGWKARLFSLFTACLPTALAAGALCLFGASALQVSSRIHAFSFGRVGQGSALPHSAGAKLLVGQFILLTVVLCPLCGAATGLAYLTNFLLRKVG